MSGQHVSYHLRTNKFIERQLFLDVLDHVRVWNSPSSYVYASMGAKFLEDIKAIHDRFSFENLISIESDATTHTRQKFNCPLGLIDCRLQTSGEFIVDFDQVQSRYNTKKFIVWLDYAAANERGTQLQEFSELMSKLTSGDVLKITLNANYESSISQSDFAQTKHFHAAVINDLKAQLGDYMPAEGANATDLKNDTFAKLLSRAVKKASLKGVVASGLNVLPLACYRYSDGPHQMMTVTTLLCDDQLKDRVSQDLLFWSWPFSSNDWDRVHDVTVPVLSIKERMLINSEVGIKNNPNTAHTELPFRFDADDATSFRLFREYLKHYRRYPSFGRIY